MSASSDRPLSPALPAYRSILLATDSSDHANRGAQEAVALAALWGAPVTAIHVYAARLHDLRFRQMEGGLPEQFRAERELERQREVHDSLITRGLSIISDSYLDQVKRLCVERAVPFVPRALEGKNYRGLIAEANGSSHDLLVLGALGIGAAKGSRLGSVASRVARRAAIDTLVIRDPLRSLSEGPLVVALDGSPRAFGALLTTLSLAGRWSVPVKAVAAFDPYYHYVAFNRIAGVLSEQAGKVFRFKEQEKLHEEIIDSGLARIYEGHLGIARSIAAEHGMEIETELLDGKPHEAIERFLRRVNASLLVVGRTGIHADDGLDIGGNAENLLRNADCAVLLGERQYQPSADRLAAATTSWTREAEAQMERVPSFARGMARMAILRYAQEQGHTVITARIAEEATARLCPHAARAMQRVVESRDAVAPERGRGFSGELRWSAAAEARMARVPPGELRDLTRARIETFARRKGVAEIGAELIEEKYAEWREGSRKQAMTLAWNAECRERIERIPDFVRGMVIKEVERCAQALGLDTVTPEVLERARGAWSKSAGFHSEFNAGQYSGAG